MLTYDLEKRGGVPIYEYLYEVIKKDILSGKLKSGEKLPSKRAFAQNLGISVISVENAYAQLLAEGYLYAREKRGYYVHTVDAGFLRHTKPQVPAAAATPEKTYFCDLKNNSLNAGFFPFSTWSKLMREILTEQYTKLLEPVPFNGVRELREQISSHLFHTKGMEVQPAQIVVGSGTENLYGALMQLFGRRKAVAVENPSYPKITKVYERNGVKTIPVPVDECGLCASALYASGAELAHLSPSHQFPLGIVMPVRRRQELLKWAYQKPGRYILEDDYDSEFRFTGRPVPSLQTMDTRERVIYINTFTKTLAPSIRISYMVLPENLAALYQKELGFYSCTVPNFEQYALAKFIEKGYLERHINRMRTVYKGQRDAVIRAVKSSPLMGRATILEENAGLHFLLKIRTEMTDREMTAAAAQNGIKITCLSEYYREEKDDSHTIVVNYSCIDVPKIEQAVYRLYTALC